MAAPDGILLVDKPPGVTSFTVVGRVRAALRPLAAGPSGGRKFRCGHAGTLDPLATGLLLVLVGRASRLSPFLMGLDKTYAATLRFGAETDTLDREGQVVGTAPAPEDPEAVAACLDRFRGEVQQIPPLYSSLKQDGTSLHRLMRAGQEVAEPQARTVTIGQLEITAARWGAEVKELDILVGCSSGTYIRSLARDLGRAAGSAAYLQALRRTRVGPFAVGDALGGVMDLGGEALASGMVSPAAAVAHLPRLVLEPLEAQAVLQGVQPDPRWRARIEGLPAGAGKQEGLFAILGPGGALVAVGRIDAELGLPRLVVVLGQREPA